MKNKGRGWVLVVLVLLGIELIIPCWGGTSATGSSWTWVSGSSTVPVPTSNSGPGSRSQAAQWFVAPDRLILYSGIGYGSDNVLGALKDCWVFKTSTGTWQWMFGSNATLQTTEERAAGSFGTKGVESSSNYPPVSLYTCPFRRPVAEPNAVYLFSGAAEMDAGIPFNFVWKLNLENNYWTWIAGSCAGYSPPAYGSIGVSDPNFFPGSRHHPGCWHFDSTNKLFIFGGFAMQPSGARDSLNDVWEYDFDSSLWTWVSGSLFSSPIPFAGAKGQFLSTNSPIGRTRPTFFKFSESEFYIFGGAPPSVGFSTLNDLWMFDINKKQWAWLDGQTNTFNAVNNYTHPYPGGHLQPSYWVFGSGHLIMLGGYGQFDDGGYYYQNDLWEYNYRTGKWKVFERIDTSSAIVGVFPSSYGTQLESNKPPSLEAASTWVDSSTHEAYLFGGKSDLWSGLQNSLWKSRFCRIFDESSSQWKDCNDCFQGSYLDVTSSSCRQCPSGTESSDLNEESMSTCKSCSAGSFSSSDGETACSSCPAGRYSTFSGSSVCAICPSGRWNADVGQSNCSGECSPGQAGTVSDSTSSSSCSLCETGKFSQQSGRSSCDDCPLLSTSLTTGSTSVSACFCTRGTYGLAFEGRNCEVCPANSGVQCDFNYTTFFVRPGFFRVSDTDVGAISCTPPEACEVSDFGETVCAEGYSGDFCSVCADGYYRLDYVCSKCPNSISFWITLIVVTVVVVFIFVRLFRKGFTVPTDVKILFSWLQLISIYPNLSDSWPSTLLGFFRASSFSNLNIELSSPECSISATYSLKWTLQLCLPFLISGMVVIMLLLNRFFGKKSKEVQVVSNKIEDVNDQSSKSLPDSAPQKVSNALETAVSPTPGVVVTPKHIKSKKPQILESMNPFWRKALGLCCFIFASLFTLCISALSEPFFCIPVEDGSLRMIKLTSVKCFEGSWYSFLPLFIIGVLVYVIAFPAVLISFFWIYRNNVDSAAFQDAFGLIVRPYSPRTFYWEVFEMSRKAAFVVAINFLSISSSYFARLFISIVVLFLSLMIENFVLPFKSRDLNQLSFVWTVVGILTLQAGGIVFPSEDVGNVEKQSLSIILLLMNIAAIGFSVRSLILKVLRERQAKKAVPGSDFTYQQ